MEGHIQKGVIREISRNRKKKFNPWMILWIVAFIGICLFGIEYFFLSPTGNVVLENYISVQESNVYDTWILGNRTGTLQVDAVIVSPEEGTINHVFSCLNGSVSNDVNSLLYLWYINGSLSNINTSTIVSGYPSVSRNFTVHDRLECGIIPQNRALVAYWPFDEGTGNTYKEIVNNNSMTSTVADWKTGRNYYAVNISVDNKYNVSSPTGLNLTKNFTYELWVYPDANANCALIDNGGVFSIGIQIGKIQGKMRIGELTPTLKIVSVNSINVSNWNHIALTYDNSTVALYLNGVLENSTALSGQIVDFTGDIVVGRNRLIPVQYFRGSIDEIAIYNQSLNAAEISDHYNRGIAILSRNNTVIVDAGEPAFQNGTMTNLSYSASMQGVILNNCSSGVYCGSGEFISDIKNISDNENVVDIFYNLVEVNGGSIDFIVQTGIRGDNGTITWSDYSAYDPAYVTDANKLLALPFSEGKGNITQDLVMGANYDLGDVVFSAEGKIGEGLRFFGEEQLTISDSPTIRLADAQNYSFEFFIKPSDSEERAIFSKSYYFAYLNSSNKVIFNATHNSVEYTLASSVPLTIGEWNYVVITHDSDNYTRMYINGSLAGTTAFNASINSTTNDLLLGGYGSLNKFNGSLDSFVMYNRTLTAEEISLRAISMSNRIAKSFDANDYVRYKAIFTSNGLVTPTLTNVTIKMRNHSVFVYDSVPINLALSYPVNNSNISSGNSSLFNWTAITDIEGDYKYYEWILSNFSNLSSVVAGHFAVNNYSIQDYTESTLLVEHFDYQEELKNHGWEGNWSNTQITGKFKSGFNVEQSGIFLRNSIIVLNSRQGAIEFWVKPYWSPGEDTTNTFFEGERGICLNRTGSLLNYRLGEKIITYSISNWNANEWHHLAVAWKENENMTLIIDGSFANTTNISDVSLSGDFYFGMNASTSSRNNVVNGIVDELKISNVYREAYSAFTSNEFNQSLVNISDGDYYWTTRAVQAANLSLDGEQSKNTTNTWIVHLRRATPYITITEDPVKQYSENVTTINLSSSENVFCQYKTLNGNWQTMNYTNESIHSMTLNITNFGNYTLYFNCNDSSNLFANDTMSYYVFNRSFGAVINISKTSFSANTKSKVNFSSEGVQMGYLEITPRNDLTSKAYMIKHDWNRNPENSSSGLDSQVIAFWTIIVDDNLVANLTGNVTTGFIYNSSDISALSAGNVSLYWYNPRTSEWEYQGVNVLTENYVASINTSRFGSFALAGNSSSSTSRRSSSTTTGDAVKRGLLKPTLKTGTKGTLGDVLPDEVVEDIVEGEDTEEETTPGEASEAVEDFLGQAAELFEGSKLILMLVYLIVGGVLVFYGYRIALALAFKLQKKKKIEIEDLEQEMDDKMKYYVYSNIENKDLENELVAKGWDTVKVERIIEKIKKLGREKFEDYIFKSIANEKNEEEIVKNLVDKGWDEKKIREEIEKFKRI